MFERQRTGDDLLDGLVGEHFAKSRLGRRAAEAGRSSGGSVRTDDTSRPRSRAASTTLSAGRVHDAGLEQDGGQMIGPQMLVERAQPAGLHQRIDQQFVGQALGLGPRTVRLR